MNWKDIISLLRMDMHIMSAWERRICRKKARRRGADIVMYGHTHVPALTIDADLVTLNPGSLTYPRQQGRQATYMVMKLEKGKQPEVELKTV